MLGFINVWDEAKQAYVPWPVITGKDGRGIRSFGYDGAQDRWVVVYTDGTTDIIQGPTLEGGAAGVSPVVEFSAIAGGTRLSITDAEGVKTADIMDGQNGISVTVANVNESSVAGGTSVVTFSDGKKLNVKNGSNGQNGSNGTSVTVTNVSESNTDGGTNTVRFSDGKTLNVKNGKRGTNGTTPVKGRDYFTAADKREVAEQAAALVPAGTGTFVVNANVDAENQTYTFDKTFDEIYAAFGAGKRCEMLVSPIGLAEKFLLSLSAFFEYENDNGGLIKQLVFSQETHGGFSYISIYSDGGYYADGLNYAQVTQRFDYAAGVYVHQFGARIAALAQENNVYLLRNSKLAASQEAPTVNGEICWTYE